VYDSYEMSSWMSPLQIPNLALIYLVGFYEEREFAPYVSSISNELWIPARFVPCTVDCFRLDWFQACAFGVVDLRAVSLNVITFSLL
jgi:hypothetical protein